MMIGYEMQLIFWRRHKFLGVKYENDVMWRHVPLDDIFAVSKYEVISII